MILNFRTQKQILDNWCWAAVTSGISLYYDPNSKWFQNNLAARLIDPSCIGVNTNAVTAALVTCNVTLDIARALQLTGNFAGDLFRPLTFGEVVQQINLHFPVCCQIVFSGSQTSHFVVIYGYQAANVVIGDSQAGIFSISYTDFLSSYRGGSWKRTIGTKRNFINE